MTEFEKALKGIEKSVEGINKNCPKCGKQGKCVGQALSYNTELKALIDIYYYDCGYCNEQYFVNSKPLGHMNEVKDFIENKNRE